MTKKFDIYSLLSFATQLGFSLITPFLVFVGLGILVDSKMGSKPAGILIGLSVGFIVSIFVLYKSIKPYMKK